jgi:Peptidase family M28
MGWSTRLPLVLALIGGPALLAQGAPRQVRVDPIRVAWTVRELAGFGTRHTLSSTTEICRGIGAARRFLAAEFSGLSAPGSGRPSSPGSSSLRLVEDRWQDTSGGERLPGPAPELVNVLGVIDGVDPVLKSHVLIISGHYDSRATDILDAMSDAPGADDDGSGTAVVLEAARVLAPLFATQGPRRTIVFAALPGEEQGLLGGRRLQAWCREKGYRVDAVLNHDIVGSPVGPDGIRRDGVVRLFSTERGGSDNPSRTLARRIAEIARGASFPVEPLLIFRRDRRGRGGDQIPFEEVSEAAVRFTEPAENYDHQHQDLRKSEGRSFGDTFEWVDPIYVAEVARLSAQTLLELASAPPPPADCRLSGAVSHDTTLSWKGGEGSEPGITYEVLVRKTSSPDWEEVRGVGTAERASFPFECSDDRIYAVRAVGRDGRKGIPVPVGEGAAR